MNIVASGTSGTIGKHLGKKVESLNQRLDAISEQKVNIHKGDVYIHLGAMVGPQIVGEHPLASRQINVDSTVRLAQHCLSIDAEKFVFISTSHVYARGSEDKTELSRIDPLNIYAEQKYETEIKLQAMFSGNKEKLLILRVFSILGWDTKPSTLGGGVRKLLTDENYNLMCGDDIRDFLTPEQAATIIVEIAQREPATGIINLCTGIGISVRDAALLMINERTSTDFSERIRAGTSNIPRLVGNPSLLNQNLGKSFKWKYL
jgi:nucleoside-diphosphate-sugar epimerase